MGNIDELLRMSGDLERKSNWKDAVERLAEEAYSLMSLLKEVDDMEFFIPYYWDVVMKNEHRRASRTPKPSMPAVGTWDNKEYCLGEIEQNFQNFRKCLFKADVIDDALIVNGYVSSMLGEFGFSLTEKRLSNIVRTREDFVRSLHSEDFDDSYVIAAYISNPDSVRYWVPKTDICYQLMNVIGNAELHKRIVDGLTEAIATEGARYGKYASDSLNSARTMELNKWTTVTPYPDDDVHRYVTELRKKDLEEDQKRNPDKYDVFGYIAPDISTRKHFFHNMFFGYELSDIQRILMESSIIDEYTKKSAEEYINTINEQLSADSSLLYIPSPFHKANHSKRDLFASVEIDKSYYSDPRGYCAVCYETQGVPVKLLIERADEFFSLYANYLSSLGVDSTSDWLYNEVDSYIKDRNKYKGEYRYRCYLTRDVLGYQEDTRVSQFL